MFQGSSLSLSGLKSVTRDQDVPGGQSISVRT